MKTDYDGFDLIQTIENASEGAVIEVPEGESHINRQIHIRKPITLRGAGKDKTRLVFTAPGEKTCEDFITIEVSQDSQPVVIEEVSFTYQGNSPGNLVVVNSGTAEFYRCSFKGAVYDEEATGGGAIVFNNNSQGTVKECDFSENGLGVEISGTAIAVIEDSRFVSNQRGIVFCENSGGRVCNNTCKNYGNHGIVVQGEAKPTLIGNTCEGSILGVGIAFEEQAGGEARNNTCKNNITGILAKGEAKPTLIGNTCEGSILGFGIAFEEQAGGEARNNTCNNNGLNGIEVQGKAKPTLVDNSCNNNGGHGIQVVGKAKPTLVGNTCEGNQESGIAYGERAKGEARNNTCNNNGLNGIEVQGKAKPTLVGNTCEGNQESGIAYGGRAKGKARNNICTGNRGGIVLAQRTKPRLINNTVRGNIEGDIIDTR